MPVERFRTVKALLNTPQAGKFVLFLASLMTTGAILLLMAGSLFAATSAQQVYETPETRTTQSTLPEIPQVAGDYVPQAPSTDPADPSVAGEVTPGEKSVPEVVGAPPAPAPAAVQGVNDTLPVTGLDLLIILGAAGTAAGVGFALRRGAR